MQRKLKSVDVGSNKRGNTGERVNVIEEKKLRFIWERFVWGVVGLKPIKVD